MIYEAMTCLMEDLNDFFRIKLKTNDNKVILSSLVNLDGSVAVQDESKVVLTLVNIEREPAAKNISLASNPVLHINLYILFSAYFSSSNYAEGLKIISMILAFFQQKGTLTPSNTPRLHPQIERLSLEVESPGLELSNNLWSSMGAKYLPSVLYKLRMLTFNGNMPDYAPVIRHSSYETEPVNT